jgi:four helix bundle protein
MASYRDLKVWQAGMLLAKRVYKLTEPFPGDERFGLVSQMRRSAVSVPANVAEGHARNTTAEMIRFSGIALGSVAEIETQLLLAADFGFADADDVDDILKLTDEIGRMLHSLIRSNRSR